MSDKLHLRLLEDKQLSEIGEVKFNYGPPIVDDENEPDYFYMAQNLRFDLQAYEHDLEIRRSEKTDEIAIPSIVDYIRITFFDQFNIDEYYNTWFTKFGLEGVSFNEFGRVVLFGVVDDEKFKIFLRDLSRFIQLGLGEIEDATYSNLIKYIKSFELLTTSEILRIKKEELGNVVVLKTIDLPLDDALQQDLIRHLIGYIESEDLEYIHNIDNETIEIFDASFEQLSTIAAHFDIIESITCSISGIIRPSTFNVPSRDYGFTIANSEDELPIIGIIDTGISMDTPLESITIQDSSFSLTGSSPLVDTAGRGSNGHGTAVAGLAALGRANHLNDFNGEVQADGRLLSIKLTDNGSGYLSESRILEMLYSAKKKYPEMRFFVLSTTYQKFKPTNDAPSSYTYALDKFSHETDSIIFISVGNNDRCINENTSYDLAYFNSPHTNLCTPADSMNNMTVGAAADGLNHGAFLGVSDGIEYPTLYSRKSHIDLSDLYPRNKTNKHLFKPDVINSGGDIGFYNSTTLDWMDDPAMTIISANPALGYVRDTGSSLAAPLTANLALKLARLYPDLKNQTIKALIINNASKNNIRFDERFSHLLNKTAGNGFVNLDETLFSNENSVTMILEDSIVNESQKIYPINFPNYLITEKLGKRRGILKVTATLCFSFKPLRHNQLSYCPIHLAFCVFKNHTSDQINAKVDELESKLKAGLTWSQSGRHKSKPVPYSNSQKLQFNVNVEDLVNEKLTFNLAVQARLSSQILKSELDSYDKEFEFSLVLRIDENLRVPKNKLYDEIFAVNNLEVLTSLDAEGDIEIEQTI